MKSHRTAKGTVLIVDDNPTHLIVLSDYLTADGFDILCAQDGESAIQRAEQEHPDIILLDILMPGLDGFEICRLLKDQSVTREIPVIFMTALTEMNDKLNAFKAGGVDYITKPLQLPEVLVRINVHLTLKRQQQHIQRQNAQLKQLNHDKDRFFSIIAHDLRGSLNSLRDLTRITAENFEIYSLPKLKEMIRMQFQTTDNLSKLLENLLIWARVQQGMIEYQPQKLDLENVITWNIQLAMLRAKQKQIPLTTTIAKKTHIVHADFNMLDTIVRNLISNALKFTHSGGSIVVAATADERNVTMSVADTGIGIPSEDLPKLFRIDFKYKHLGTEHEPGTGLGLILCKEFVEKNGGNIWVESTEGKGSTFYVSFPKA
ncbi:response regulator receiver sensor signal transduction histidine kinase [Candidatus Vecturithrix granuli]|uniref:histidine kinase n=1 Tax=Vecturithrix granuli TaxID=1499967 RepID=A0A081C812_VECG1|nr:response regulator receiver sensor signal transduction histidine kinase [Candidatus Vecturithrix granuli]